MAGTLALGSTSDSGPDSTAWNASRVLDVFFIEAPISVDVARAGAFVAAAMIASITALVSVTSAGSACMVIAAPIDADGAAGCVETCVDSTTRGLPLSPVVAAISMSSDW